jgi:hypothetical protein
VTAIKTKRCYHCKQIKLVCLFHKNKRSKDGVCWVCKICYNKYRKLHPTSKEVIRKAKKKYYDKNEEKRKQYYEQNKERIKQANRDWHKKHRKKDKNIILKRLYGITLKEYNDFLQSQNGVCKVCKEPSKKNRRLCVDHNHKTGEIRGLLCDSCNKALGLLKDDKRTVKNLYVYLNNTQ